MKRSHIVCLFFVLVPPALLCAADNPAAHDPSVLLCGGANVIQASVLSADGKVTLQTVWEWRPERSAGLPVPLMRKFITTDDCKSVSAGKEILITSSGDAVALVSHETGDTLFYANVINAHSAELLPGGLIAVASSSDPANKGSRILLYDRNRSDKPLGFIPLRAAHGVEWDKKRNVLWAMGGDALLRLRLDLTGPGPHLVEEKSYALPPSEGHDLQLAGDDSLLYVTNQKSVFTVDPDHIDFKPFAAFNGASQIKSLSVNPESGQIAYTKADPGVWWTYTLHFLNPEAEVTLPSMIYKVRWYTR